MPESSPSITVLLGHLPTTGRLTLTRLLETQAGIRVVNVSDKPAELVGMARRLRPALLIVSEVQVRTLELLTHYLAVPVVLYCEAVPLAGTLRETRRWGVVDYILASGGCADWAGDVLRKIRQYLPQAVVPLPAPARLPEVPGLPGGVIIVGGSTGGTAAVEQLVRSLPATLACAVVVAVHLPGSFLDSFVKRLARVSALPVVAGWPGTQLEPGRIIVAPGGHNLEIRPALNSPWQSWQTDFSSEYSPSGDEPSIDILMRSAARTAGRNVLGVILTGLGRDGTLGAQVIRQHGGTVLVQDEASSAVFSMPKSVIQAGWAHAVLPLDELPAAIVRHAGHFRRVSVRPAATLVSRPV
ncbi:chemotaxis protein CheB [Hymenobacter sp. BT186]|uniref:protein-glutamate methylesterase n=1 Tax=Hymenobacter telluris TaxID=2816474 RepID=A0A939F0N5_9BACT|nr:CheB methylesterase domain-containing protein [Hymenobacter telluris]MBO0360975.1 chemotaxis protein CheB [Hymenobacter telluris]MBW3377003.1 chemotaxis protein CheB [Hymenobacter norwichensis]